MSSLQASHLNGLTSLCPVLRGAQDSPQERPTSNGKRPLSSKRGYLLEKSPCVSGVILKYVKKFSENLPFQSAVDSVTQF